jgi:hypothetical protein
MRFIPYLLSLIGLGLLLFAIGRGSVLRCRIKIPRQSFLRFSRVSFRRRSARLRLARFFLLAGLTWLGIRSRSQRNKAN